MSWSEDISHTCHLDHLIGQFTLYIIVGFFVTLELFIQLTQGRIVESYSILPCVYCSEALVVSKCFFLLQIWIKNQTIKTRRQSTSPIKKKWSWQDDLALLQCSRSLIWLFIICGLVFFSALRDLSHYQIQSGTPKRMMLNRFVSFFLCTSVFFDQHLTFTKLNIEDGTIVSISITYY